MLKYFFSNVEEDHILSSFLFKSLTRYIWAKTRSAVMEFKVSQFQNYFFVGIAGTGMSAIAQYLKGIGKVVSGSDRQFNSENKLLIQEQFETMGIECYFQNGSGITSNTEVVVISTAIEETNPELIKASDLGILVIKRSELLAAISEEKKTIAVGGSAGKSTTTAMIFHILQESGYSPSLITGAGLTELQSKGLPGNAWVGTSDWLVIEADESDGSIVNYIPQISVLLNIARDHKEIDELMRLFSTFKANTRGEFIINAGSDLIKTLSQDKALDFGSGQGTGFLFNNFSQDGFQINFTLNDIPCSLNLIGRHNMENAAAAIAVAHAAGISVESSAYALQTYKGIFRRTQLIGDKNGILLIDDFAHNPEEVVAAIKTCQLLGKRVFAWFQPHGFGPLKFMHEELINKVIETMRPSDYFLMSDVYYAGGTVSKEITSETVIKVIKLSNKNALLVNDRNNLAQLFNILAETGDVVLLMGARDPSLAEFAKNMLVHLK